MFDDAMHAIRYRLDYPSLLNLSLTCKSERRDAIEHKRSRAAMLLHGLYGRLAPMMGPIEGRSSVYDGLLHGRGRVRIVLTACIDPVRLNVVVTDARSYEGEFLPATTHYAVISPRTNDGIVFEKVQFSEDREVWQQADISAVRFVRRQFRIVDAFVVAAAYESEVDYLREHVWPRIYGTATGP